MRRDEQILEAAAELFLEQGFRNVTLDEIGGQVGITGPAIYRHFANKDEILASLIDRTMDRLLLILEPTDENAEPAARLDALVRAQVDFALTNRRMVTIYGREGHSLSSDSRRHASRRQRDHVERWVHAMEAMYPDRSTDELLAAAHACIGLTLSIAQWPEEAFDAPGLEVLLYELVLGALAALGPSR